MSLFRALFAAFCASFLALASPANASPDTFIDIHEEPVGMSGTHLFLLRTATDNLGYYEALRAEIFLIVQDLRSGEEEVIVVDKFVHSSDYTDDGDLAGYSIKRDAGIESIDPYSVMRARGGLPWTAALTVPKSTPTAKITMVDGAVQVQFDTGPALRITREDIQAKLNHVGRFMAENVADHPRSASMTTRQFFEERTVSAEQCYHAEWLGFWFLGKGNKPPLLRVHCAYDDDSETTSVIVRLPAAQE
ncbi:MAG: hypothetical protein ABJK59_03665 [Erythrobacter sp.]|uniref:hypothetical protein n=1 Tax=Erythrobacter sp. TaxID=1042 RepID=UPI003297F295